MPHISGVLNSLSPIFASLLRSSPLCKSSYWIFFTFIPLRHLKYNPSKLKLIVTSLKLAPLLFIPCRLVTSPFTQARNITASLPTLFFNLSFNQPDIRFYCISPKTTFQVKEEAQHQSAVLQQRLCMSRSFQMDSYLRCISSACLQNSADFCITQKNDVSV